MSVDVLLFALADARLEADARYASFMANSVPWAGGPDCTSEIWADIADKRASRLGAWRMTWWR